MELRKEMDEKYKQSIEELKADWKIIAKVQSEILEKQLQSFREITTLKEEVAVKEEITLLKEEALNDESVKEAAVKKEEVVKEKANLAIV
ncbi:hypothetical protein TSUD_309640 [Trifolium subterraneum]|uniref:Uncharacterized protein n=1 Tax=Trifolium subterraneum TaxID=3900 RepID=A0A2Z6MFL6_TRISU|nr:hypothetical protein TSUD_309640 [Trifolium subterraneum]